MNHLLLLAAVAPASDGPVRDATSTDWLLLGLYLALALGVSFLCSLLEAGLLSVPMAHVRVMVERGSKRGKRLLQMKENLDRPLAAILTLNTIAHTIGAAGVGAQILVIFGSEAVAIGSAVVTLLILVLSEIIPKSLGASQSKRLAGFTTLAVQVMIWITLPLLIPLNYLSRWFGGGESHSMTRDEVAVVADLGEDSGALNPSESRVIRNVIALSKITVHDIMTPRPMLFTLEVDQTVRQVLDAYDQLRFSRIPLQRHDADHIEGFVTRHKLLQARQSRELDRPLTDLAEPLHRVPETENVADTMNRMVRQQEHVLLVVDEFGGTEGLVTLEDCIETLLGAEIVDETDAVDDMREAARQRLEARRMFQTGAPSPSPPVTEEPSGERQ